jgi:hypothetical protein
MDDPVNGLPDRIARALSALDARAQRSAARLEVERVAGLVERRLRSGEAPLAWWTRALPVSRAARMAAAAAVVLLAVGAALTALQDRGARPAPVLAIQGVDSLSGREARAVLQVVDEIRAVNDSAAVSSVVSVEDLSESELRALLQAMQSTEGDEL